MIKFRTIRGILKMDIICIKMYSRVQFDCIEQSRVTCTLYCQKYWATPPNL